MGGLVLDARDLEASSLEGADGGLTTGAGALDEDRNLLHTVLHGLLGSSLGSHLGSERRGLTGALEAHLSSRLPGNDVALGIGDRNDRVVERRTDVSLAHGNVLTVRALQTGSANVLLSSSHLSSAPYFFFLAPI